MGDGFELHFLIYVIESLVHNPNNCIVESKIRQKSGTTNLKNKKKLLTILFEHRVAADTIEPPPNRRKMNQQENPMFT